MPDKIFGLPAWAAIATLGAAGVVGYLIFIRGQGGSSSSSGSTYSPQGLAVMQNPDESATMAAQNQLLSQMAVNMQTGFETTNANIGEVGQSVDTGFSSVGTSLNSISGQLGTLQQAQSSGFTNLSNQVAGVSGQVGQLSASDAAQYSALANALGAWGNSLSAGQSSLSQQVTNFQNEITSAVTSGQQLTQKQIDQLGGFLGWQFYQIPNRYQAFIPAGVNPPGWS